MSPRNPPLPSGEAKISVKSVGASMVGTARVMVDYHTRSEGGIGGGDSPARRIMDAMLDAARETDNRIYAEQNPDKVRHGILRAGDLVLTEWMELSEDELLKVSKPRKATPEEMEGIPSWGDDGWEDHVKHGPAPRMVEED